MENLKTGLSCTILVCQTGHGNHGKSIFTLQSDDNNQWTTVSEEGKFCMVTSHNCTWDFL